MITIEESQIAHLKGQYDEKRDAGNMTWADMCLLELVEALLKKIKAMEYRIESLENSDADDEGEMSIAQAVQIASLAKSWGVNR